jgi:hypothetical protein
MPYRQYNPGPEDRDEFLKQVASADDANGQLAHVLVTYGNAVQGLLREVELLTKERDELSRKLDQMVG